MRHLIQLIVATTVLGGCTVYRIKSAEDHGKLPVTKLELERTTNFYFYAEVVHEFWICEDKGDDLLCVASCGTRDLECPTSVYNANGMSSNTQ